MLENKRGVTTEQLLLLLDELENNPAMSRDRVMRATKNIYDVKWELLVNKLNAVPNGAKRSVPRWKTVLNNWKTTIKRQATNDENDPAGLDELGKRLLRLVEVEEVINDIDQEVEMNNENIVFRRPQLRRSSRRRSRVEGPGPEHSVLALQRSQKSLKTIYGNNVEYVGSPENQIMQQQLDRLYHVSQALESHIQSVQNRIQQIKDMWQHECHDE